MGRRNLSNERRNEILRATADCIQRFGLEGTTLERVAVRAGMQRTIIRHYVGNRDELLASLIERITEQYRDDYRTLAERLPRRRRVEAVITYLFSGEFLTRAKEDAVIDALLATAATDGQARASLRKMYQVFEDVCYAELRAAFPTASQQRVRAVAYAIVCLAEQNTALLRLGFPRRRAAAARWAVQHLVDSLRIAGPAHQSPKERSQYR